jgi:hypothetical protein
LHNLRKLVDPERGAVINPLKQATKLAAMVNNCSCNALTTVFNGH